MRNATLFPSPDLTTPLATKNATIIIKIKLLEKPEYASIGEIIPVRNDIARASIEATIIGIAFVITAIIVLKKIIKSFQALGSRSTGDENCHKIKPKIIGKKGLSCFITDYKTTQHEL